MTFKEWKKTLTFEYDQTALNLAFHAFQAGSDARKKKDEQIARDAASHNMASIVHAQNIAELIEEAE